MRQPFGTFFLSLRATRSAAARGPSARDTGCFAALREVFDWVFSPLAVSGSLPASIFCNTLAVAFLSLWPHYPANSVTAAMDVPWSIHTRSSLALPNSLSSLYFPC